MIKWKRARTVVDALAPEAGGRVAVGDVVRVDHAVLHHPLARVQPAVRRKPDAEADQGDGRRDAGDDGQTLVVAASPPHRAAFTAGREEDGRLERVRRRRDVRRGWSRR